MWRKLSWDPRLVASDADPGIEAVLHYCREIIIVEDDDHIADVC